jgi:hypothetical protein
MTFVRGGQKPPNSGRKKGGGNRRALVHPDALNHLAEVVASTDPLITPELKLRAAIGLAQYQHPKPTAPRGPTFAPTPFKLNDLVTLEDAGTETQRIAVAVASGKLDHDTGQFLVAAIRTFMDSLGAIKAEQEDARIDAVQKRSGPQ